MTSTAEEALNLPALANHFDRIGVTRNGALRADLISGGRSNLTFLIYDDKSTWVLRRRPLQGVTPSAHDMGREYRVVAALAGSGFPVARPVTLSEDDSILGAPFAVVEYVMGQVIRTEEDLAVIASDDAVEQCVGGLVDVLADLHAVEPGAVGLGDFGRPDGYLERQVRRWAGQWNLVQRDDDPRDNDVRRLHELLADGVPAQSGTSIVHGDYRIDNTILESTLPHRVGAVVDWEMSTLGDPLADAALMCVYRDPIFDLVIGVDAAWTSDRMPSADTMAQRYSVSSGRDLQGWNYYLALGYFKVAVIAAGIAYRQRTIDGAADVADDAVAPFIAKGLRILGNGAG